MDLSLLERIGLSNAEVRVYLALLSLGSVPSSRIVDETSLRKSTVYESIGRLQERGLVSYVIKDKRRYFEGADPEKLVDFVEDQKRLLDEYGRAVADLVPAIRGGLTPGRPRAEAHVLAGVEGFKTMRRDILRSAKGELLLLGAISRENEVMPAFYKNWNTSRQLKGIFLRVLHKESARRKAMTDKRFMGELFETRFLPRELESPAVINVYGDHVVNVLWKRDYPLCFMLINQDIADSYRRYFEYLWDIAKP
jgi:HTH-type transcriptional regulator, sugar sensing transcriptional regulator